MAATTIRIKESPPFDFYSVIESHGWVDLLPNVFYSEKKSFSRIEELSSGKVIQIEISADKNGGDGNVSIEISHKGKLAKSEIIEVRAKVEHMLRMDEDFSEFYDLCKQKGKPWSGLAQGKGRLLRSPDLFEDIVKVICTTNIQWGGTKRMVKELVTVYGKPYALDPELKTFPKLEAIAEIPFSEFQSSLRLGYRANYIHTLALEMAKDPSSYRYLTDRKMSSSEVKKELLAIKGVGNYAAASILMLLGRYDEIPVDSVFRQLMRDKYYKESDYKLEDALSIYDDWNQWKYLAYWFDLLNFHHSS